MTATMIKMKGRCGLSLVGAVMLLLLLLLVGGDPWTPAPVAAASVAASTCGDIGGMLQDVHSECGVSALADLYRTVNYNGPASFCTASCLLAVRALNDALPFCANADAVLGVTQVHTQVRQIRTKQAACNAPSIECLRVQRQFDSWLRTAAGVSCLDTMHDAATLPDTTASQAELSTTCTGTCHSGFTFYLSQYEEAGCVAWDVYKLNRELFDLTCASAPALASSGADTVYCRNQFNPERSQAQLQLAQNTSLTQAERDTALEAVCTPCFYEYLRILSREAGNSSQLAQLEILCVRDGSTFCYPRFADVLAFTDAAGPAQRGRQLCQLGRCADKMVARLRNHPALATAPVASDLAAQADTHLTYMCLQSREGETCVEAMANIIDGFDASLEFVGTPFSGPGACEDIDEGDYCTWGCQRRFVHLVDSVGCCHHATRAYLIGIGAASAQVDEAFAPVETVATECRRPLDPACTLFNQDYRADMDVAVPFPKRFLKRNRDVLGEELVALLGRPPNAFEIRGISEQSGDTSTVTVRLLFEGDPRRSQVVSSIEADLARGDAAFLMLAPLHYTQVTLAAF